MPICQNCTNEFPNRVEIEGKVRNLSSREYCLECSPFGEHNTRQIHRPNEEGICHDCGREFDYDRSKGHRTTRCNSCREKKRRHSRKAELVEIFGGECRRCGYSVCLSALTFHHTNPDEKKFALSGNNYNRKWQVVLEEAHKCILLCENCHREEHCSRC